MGCDGELTADYTWKSKIAGARTWAKKDETTAQRYGPVFVNHLGRANSELIHESEPPILLAIINQ